MKYDRFLAAFKRAEGSNGPWFSGDSAADVAADIRMFCQEDWEEMMDATDDQQQLMDNIRHILSKRPQG